MGALNALRTAGSTLGRNPVLILAAAILTLVSFLYQLPNLLFTGSPLLSGLVSLALSLVFFLLVPFFFGGLVGMADEAIDGQTSFGTLVAAGKRHYLSLLGAYFLVAVVSIAVGIVFAIVVFGGIVLAATGSQTTGAAFGLFAIAFLVVALIFLVIFFFLQFYGQAIVVDDLGALAGFKRSVGVVRRNLVSTIGYTVVVVVVGAIIGLFSAVASIALVPSPAMSAYGPTIPTLSPAVLAVGGIVGFVVLTVVSAFMLTYSVAFYRQIHPVDEGTDPNANPGTNTV